jgi:hypothetical protein
MRVWAVFVPAEGPLAEDACRYDERPKNEVRQKPGTIQAQDVVDWRVPERNADQERATAVNK